MSNRPRQSIKNAPNDFNYRDQFHDKHIRRVFDDRNEMKKKRYEKLIEEYMKGKKDAEDPQTEDSDNDE